MDKIYNYLFLNATDNIFMEDINLTNTLAKENLTFEKEESKGQHVSNYFFIILILIILLLAYLFFKNKDEPKVKKGIERNKKILNTNKTSEKTKHVTKKVYEQSKPIIKKTVKKVIKFSEKTYSEVKPLIKKSLAKGKEQIDKIKDKHNK